MGSQLVNVLRAGLLRYSAGLELQSAVRDQVRSGTLEDTLVVVEHYPVYTVGLRDKSYTVEDEDKLRNLGADFHRTNRGGLITFHGPGQLVIYPILNLKNYEPSVRWYIFSLEETIIQVCKEYGLKGYRSPHTGVWVHDKKMCALGVHASRYITTHGLALNCNTNLDWFSHIVPCGIPDKGVTSLTEEKKKEIVIDDALPKFLKSFQSVFGVKCLELSEEKVASLIKSN